jgi:hypothetical protein
MTTIRTENQRWTVDRGDRKPSVDVFLAALHHRGRVEREIYVHWLNAYPADVGRGSPARPCVDGGG